MAGLPISLPPRVALALALAIPLGAMHARADSAATNAAPRVGLAAFPGFTYSPETSVAAGAGATLTFRPRGREESAHPDNVSASVLFTAKSQFTAALNPELYFGHDAWVLRAETLYRRYPDDFYGIGNDVSMDAKESFTSRDIFLKPSVLHRVWSGLRAGGFFAWKHTDVRDVEPGGLLAGGQVRGAQGGTISGAGVTVEWDTRDNLFAPTRGCWHQASAAFCRDALGSDFDYEEFAVDLRRYTSLRPGRVLALEAALTAASGDVPFTELPRLDTLRGILNNRYRDRNALMGQAEYRFPLRGRFSGVAFAAAGEVAHELDSWNLGIKVAAGAGLRYTLNAREQIHLRLDLGVSPDGICPYLHMLEAF